MTQTTATPETIQSPPWAVVLDTNVFYGDRYAQKDLLSAVLAGAEAGDYEIVVPRVVILELTRQFRPVLEKAVTEANQAIARSTRELARFGIASVRPPEVDVPSLSASYEKTLTKRLLGAGVRIADHPDSLATAVDWAVSKRKPFKSEGEGLPDAVIWLTVLETAKDRERVLLVSEN